MCRKLAVLLLILLLVNTPVLAQSGGPLPRTSVHIVQRGETMFSIARRYGLTVDAITHANGLPDPRKIYVGQRLTIPGGELEIKPEETRSYIVQAGDTLTAIARRYNTTWQALVQINGMLSPDALYAGQVLQVPALGNETSKSISRPLGEGAVHLVQADDTLLRIALRYDISPWALTSVSHVANPALIYPGQALVVPGEGDGLLPEPFVSIEIEPLPALQGKTTVIAVRTTEPVALEGNLFEKTVHFASENGVYYGLVGVHVFTEPGLYKLTLQAVDSEGRSSTITTDVKVESERFSYEHIGVSNERAYLLDPDVIASDRARLDAVRQTFTQERHWNEAFRRPCAGNVTSYFGTHRAYNGSPYTSYHSGIDFRAPSGTPVYAPAGGTVVMAETLGLWGHAVALDHGWGVLTGYGHLSSVEVEMGQRVTTGDMIGRVGNSGLSTGAHLHWEMWVGGTSVSGLQWLDDFYPWPQPSMADSPALQQAEMSE